MRWACSSRFVAVLMTLCCAVLAACTDGATPAGTPQMTTPAAMPELITLAETQPYRERIAQGLGNISWASAYVSPTPQAAAQGEATARAAIQASAQPLAAVDYVALALPDWVTVTRKLQVAPGDFTAGATAYTPSLVEGTATPAVDADGVGSLCRRPDGVDSDDHAVDWRACASSTPGDYNLP